MTVIMLALALVSVAAPTMAQTIRQVGTITEISGTVFLAFSQSGVEMRLERDRDEGRVLLDGQVLRCGGGGRVQFLLADGRLQTLTSSMKPIRLQAPASSTLSPRDRDLLSMLDALGRPGGRRGESTIWQSPADQGRVRAQSFEVRWRQAARATHAAIELRADTGAVIWSLPAVDLQAGRLGSSETADLFKKIREHSGDHTPIMTLSIVHPDGGATSMRFRLLGREDESRLEAELEQWQRLPVSWLTLAARAYTFDRFGLFNEGEAAMAQALAQLPKSETLLRASVAMAWKTGNVQRVIELSSLLEKLKPRP